MRTMTFAALLALAPAVLGQTAPAKRAEFDVASVKQTPGNPTYIRLDPRADRFVAEHVPLKVLVGFAYGLQDWQIEGGPEWVEAVRENPKWDIEAKPAMPASRDAMRLMVQSLLADRFRLRVHQEKRQGDGYQLTVAGRNSLKSSTTDSCPTPAGTCGGVFNFGGAIAPKEIGQRASMAQLATELSMILGTVVEDGTALTGLYDFTFSWKPEDGQPGVRGGQLPYSGDKNAPTLFEALQDQLGLRLQRKKVSLDMLVIDSAEPASEN